jgi:hypothetical protein
MPKKQIEKPTKPIIPLGDFSTYGETNIAAALIYLADVLLYLSEKED